MACMCMLTDGGQYRILEHHIFHTPVAKVFHVLACFLDMLTASTGGAEDNMLPAIVQ